MGAPVRIPQPNEAGNLPEGEPLPPRRAALTISPGSEIVRNEPRVTRVPPQVIEANRVTTLITALEITMTEDAALSRDRVIALLRGLLS